MTISRRSWLKSLLALPLADGCLGLQPPVTPRPGTRFMSSGPISIGRTFDLEETVIYIKRESFHLALFDVPVLKPSVRRTRRVHR